MKENGVLTFCKHCGKEITGKHKYCSNECYHKARDTRIIRSCLFCGNDFKTSHRLISFGGGKYCSRKCAEKDSKKSHRIPKICAQCGEEFIIDICHEKRGHGKFCSRKCADKGRTTKVIKVCPICEKEFQVHLSRLKKGGGKYCSVKCAHNSDDFKEKVRVASSSKTGTSASNWRGGKTKQTCAQCGKEISVFPSKIKAGNGKFCSKKCSNKYNVQFSPLSKCGADHPGWKGGISFEPYCVKFNKEFKERVRAFFGHQCAECGKLQSDDGMLLHVHHVTFNKETCCDKTIPLFVPLCHSCHGKSGHNRIFWEYWFTEMINRHYDGKCYYPKETL